MGHILVYDPATDSWSAGPSYPSGRKRGAAGAVYDAASGLLYVVCGIQNGHWDGNVAWLDSYHVASGVWAQLADAPRVRDHFQAALVGGKIYVAGGRQTSASTGQIFNTVQAATDVYDIASNTWTTLPSPSGDLPHPRAGSMTIVLDERFVLVGGGESLEQDAAHSDVHALDVQNRTWSTWPSFAIGRHGSAIARIDDKLYVASGSGRRGGQPELTSIESALVLGSPAGRATPILKAVVLLIMCLALAFTI